MAKTKDFRTYETAARMLRAVAHPVRMQILTCLTDGKRLSVGELQARLGTSQSMTSQHLAALKNVGILKSVKEANVCYYSIENWNVLKLLDCVEHCCNL